MAPGHDLSYTVIIAPPSESRYWSSAVGHFYHGYIQDDLTWPVFGRRSPEDFVAQIRELCSRVVDDPKEPDSVRRAARHVCAQRPDEELLQKRELKGWWLQPG